MALPLLALACPVNETVSPTANVARRGGVDLDFGRLRSRRPQINLASAQSAWSELLPSPLSVTTRRRFLTPVMSRSMFVAADAPVRTADWASWVVVPFHSWNRTLPGLPTSSSMPRTDWNRVQAWPVRSSGMLVRVESRHPLHRSSRRRDGPPRRPLARRWNDQVRVGPTHSYRAPGGVGHILTWRSGSCPW